MADLNQYGNQKKKGKYKYPTSEERKKIFAELIKHCEEGYNLDSFGKLSVKAMKDYCNLFPMDFPSDLLNEAISKGKKLWEKRGTDGTIGKIEGFKEKTYQFIMMNKYGYSLNQRNDVNVKANVNVKEMSEDELNEVVDG